MELKQQQKKEDEEVLANHRYLINKGLFLRCLWCFLVQKSQKFQSRVQKAVLVRDEDFLNFVSLSGPLL
jgi:hypothetical protein